MDYLLIKTKDAEEMLKLLDRASTYLVMHESWTPQKDVELVIQKLNEYLEAKIREE